MKADYQKFIPFKHVKDMEKAYTTIIDTLINEMGYDTKKDLQNFAESPARCAKGFLEIVKPKNEVETTVEKIMKDFDTDYTGMVLAQNIIAFSMCPHHLLPVIYRISVAYIPYKTKSRVLGISKLARLAETLAARPVLQETLTTDIAESLSIDHAKSNKFKGIKSVGSATTIEGIHLCMAARGVRQHEARIVTQKLCGAFMDRPEVRAEYMSFIQSNRPERLL